MVSRTIKDTTFVIGYWEVKNNKKRSFEHYLKYLPKTFKLLKNCKIVFFYSDEKILKFVKKHLRTKDFEAIKINVSDLPTYEISKDYLKSCKKQDNTIFKNSLSKLKITYNLLYLKSGSQTYRELFTIWTSKLFLVEKVIKKNPFHTSNFAWVDASISRVNRRFRWNFTKQKFSKKVIYHYRGEELVFNEQLKLIAGFLLGKKEIFLKLIKLFKKQLEESKDSNFAMDEEVLLHFVHKNNEKLFYNIQNVTGLQRIIFLKFKEFRKFMELKRDSKSILWKKVIKLKDFLFKIFFA